jgi:hypothetical protein
VQTERVIACHVFGKSPGLDGSAVGDACVGVIQISSTKAGEQAKGS